MRNWWQLFWMLTCGLIASVIPTTHDPFWHGMVTLSGVIVGGTGWLVYKCWMD